MLMKVKYYKENEIIFKEGETGDKLYFLETGKIKVYSKSKYMREMDKGPVFGEVALLFDEPRVATVIAISYCKI